VVVGDLAMSCVVNFKVSPSDLTIPSHSRLNCQRPLGVWLESASSTDLKARRQAEQEVYGVIAILQSTAVTHAVQSWGSQCGCSVQPGTATTPPSPPPPSRDLNVN
jgi:hypothetical protein